MVKLLDTHQHLLYRSHFDYLWSDSLLPLSGRDFTLADYKALTAGHEILGSLFMEVDVGDAYRDETRFVAGLCNDPDSGLLGIISSCRPEDSTGFDTWLEECNDLPVVGFRRILHEVSDDLSRSALFRENIRKIGARGHVFDMVFRADQLTVARELATACDDVTLVLDHCGVPDIANGDFEAWRSGITGLSNLANVHCKISGILAYCPRDAASLETVRPYIEHVIESFGSDRLVWGSDWPVVDLRASLPTWISVYEQAVLGLSVDEQAAIGYLNAQKIYGLDR